MSVPKIDFSKTFPKPNIPGFTQFIKDTNIKVDNVKISNSLPPEKIKEHMKFLKDCNDDIGNKYREYCPLSTDDSQEWKDYRFIYSKIINKIDSCNEFLNTKVSAPQNVETPTSSNSNEEFTAQELVSVIMNDNKDKFQFRNDVKIDKKVEFKAWRNSPYPSDTLNIQCIKEFDKGSQNKKLAIRMDEEGEIVEVRVNGNSQKENPKKVPDEWMPALYETAFQELPQTNPSDQRINIKVVRDEIQNLPEKFLLELDVAINKINQKIDVTYLKKEAPSKRDVSRVFSKGGLTRDFLDELLKGLTQQSKELSFKKAPNESSLYILLSKDKAQLNLNENSLFQALGKLLMFCWYSKTVQDNTDDTILLGTHLDPSLFNMIFTLTSEEIEGNFDQIPEKTKLNMVEKFLLTQDMDTYYKYTSPLQALRGSSNLDLADIKKNHPELAKKLEGLDKEKYMQILKEDLFEGLEVEKMLRAGHSIAKGMKSFVMGVDKDWNKEKTTYDFKEFSNKIQGRQDHQPIVTIFGLLIAYNQCPQITEKLTWIQDWLKTASSEKVQKFLKYYTGSPSLSDFLKITIRPSVWDHKPYPVLNPCNGNILISPKPCSDQDYNDKTKEEFIRGLEAVINK